MPAAIRGNQLILEIRVGEQACKDDTDGKAGDGTMRAGYSKNKNNMRERDKINILL